MKILITLFVATAFSVGLASLGHGSEPIPTDSSKGAASDLTIKGDVQMIEGEFYFVKDTTGHQVRLHVNNETKLEDRIKVGDKIEARVTPEGHVAGYGSADSAERHGAAFTEHGSDIPTTIIP